MWINSVTTLSLSVILCQCVKERSHLYISKRCAKHSNVTLSFANLVCQSVKERFHLHICKCHAKTPKLTLWQIFLTLLNSSAWHWTLFNWHHGTDTLTHRQDRHSDTDKAVTLTTWHWQSRHSDSDTLTRHFKAFWRDLCTFVVWLATKGDRTQQNARKYP